MKTIFRKIRRLLLLDVSCIFMLPEVFFYIFLAHFKLHFTSFKELSESMGLLMKETSNDDKYDCENKLICISKTIDIVANNFFLKTTCYPRALCAKWMLNKRKLCNTLYLGVRKYEHSLPEGHAWIRCGSHIITGKKGHKTFTIIATYA